MSALFQFLSHRQFSTGTDISPLAFEVWLSRKSRHLRQVLRNCDSRSMRPLPLSRTP